MKQLIPVLAVAILKIQHGQCGKAMVPTRRVRQWTISQVSSALPSETSNEVSHNRRQKRRNAEASCPYGQSLYLTEGGSPMRCRTYTHCPEGYACEMSRSGGFYRRSYKTRRFCCGVAPEPDFGFGTSPGDHGASCPSPGSVLQLSATSGYGSPVVCRPGEVDCAAGFVCVAATGLYQGTNVCCSSGVTDSTWAWNSGMTKLQPLQYIQL